MKVLVDGRERTLGVGGTADDRDHQGQGWYERGTRQSRGEVDVSETAVEEPVWGCREIVKVGDIE